MPQGNLKFISIVLAGGEGKRLYPLTRDRAKPAVPFGGVYRLIDFALSNLVNAGYRQIAVLTQYKSHSLDRHLALGWQMNPMFGTYVAPVPAQMRRGPHWFSGSADAIYQNFNILNDEQPDHVLVFGADHIYRMDPRQMVDHHIAKRAGVTVAGIRVPLHEAPAFGVIEADASGKIISFQEKPKDPKPTPDDPNAAFVSMGNYVFETNVLREVLVRDASDTSTSHDIGGDVIPQLVAEGVAYVYDYADNAVPGQDSQEKGYWRDVGTIDAYYDANMDVIAIDPVFSFYNRQWPIFTYRPTFFPPAKFVFDEAGRRGQAVQSIVGAGVIVSGGTAVRSVLSSEVHLHSYSLVEDSVLFPGVDVGRGAVVRRAIVDKNVKIPPGVQIGVDVELDRARFLVTDSGIVVIGKGDIIPES